MRQCGLGCFINISIQISLPQIDSSLKVANYKVPHVYVNIASTIVA